MDEDIPKNFDLIVVGTGFVESVLASAASRIGKSVLHLDANSFYGDKWSSFNFDSFQSFLNSNEEFMKSASLENTKCVNFVEQEWHNDSCMENSENMWNKTKILESSRKFNIDLVPKLLFSSGNLVNLLISSNISRYAEFRAVDNICTIFEDQVHRVPCSRTDVFNSKDLTIVEKRLLMKFLTQCVSYDESPEQFSQFKGKTFLEFLQENHLSKKIQHSVLYSISMSNTNTTFEEGMENIKKFLNSLGRYGNTPFLFPMYGCGELPQCFCRLCAVFGGIYCLNKSIKEINIQQESEDIFVEIKFDDLSIKGKNIVIGNINLSENLIKNIKNCYKEKSDEKKCGNLARAIFITASPIGNEELNSDGGGVNFLHISNNNTCASVIQLSHYSGTCPKGLYLIHVTASSITDNPKIDLQPIIDQICNLPNSPKILYSCYFKIPCCIGCKLGITSSKPLKLACGPFFELDYDSSIEHAKILFNEIYPGNEFLPRAPDPEEIVMGDEDPTQPSLTAVGNDKFIIEDIKGKIQETENLT